MHSPTPSTSHYSESSSRRMDTQAFAYDKAMSLREAEARSGSCTNQHHQDRRMSKRYVNDT